MCFKLALCVSGGAEGGSTGAAGGAELAHVRGRRQLQRGPATARVPRARHRAPQPPAGAGRGHRQRRPAVSTHNKFTFKH